MFLIKNNFFRTKPDWKFIKTDLVGLLQGNIFLQIHAIISLQWIIGNLQMTLQLKSFFCNLQIKDIVYQSCADFS